MLKNFMMIKNVMMIREKRQQMALQSHSLPQKTLVTVLEIIKVDC